MTGIQFSQAVPAKRLVPSSSPSASLLGAALKDHSPTGLPGPTQLSLLPTVVMCPLRYVLLLLSLLVALIGLTQALSEQEMSIIAEEYEGDDEKNGKRASKSTFRTLVDMLNGKYLYDAYKANQMRIKAD